MKVPGKTKDYEKLLSESREELVRLRKGLNLLEKALNDNDVTQCLKVARLWEEVSTGVFNRLEDATLIHQQILTNNSVLLRTNGQLIKEEDIIHTRDAVEMNMFLLSSIGKLKEVFGEQYTEMLEIKH